MLTLSALHISRSKEFQARTPLRKSHLWPRDVRRSVAAFLLFHQFIRLFPPYVSFLPPFLSSFLLFLAPPIPCSLISRFFFPNFFTSFVSFSRNFPFVTFPFFPHLLLPLLPLPSFSILPFPFCFHFLIFSFPFRIALPFLSFPLSFPSHSFIPHFLTFSPAFPYPSISPPFFPSSFQPSYPFLVSSLRSVPLFLSSSFHSFHRVLVVPLV